MTAARKSSHYSSAWATSRQGHTSRLRWRACANSPLPASPPCMAQHCAEPILTRYSQRSNGPAVRYREIDYRLGWHKRGYRSATPGLPCPGVLLHTVLEPQKIGVGLPTICQPQFVKFLPHLYDRLTMNPAR